MNVQQPVYDLVVIGGGINGCGIARDAAGRGLKVLLCEKDDLAQATSSASTKLFHGGLRYLEYFEFRLVKKALEEREVLLRNMPHISWPMRFVLPHDPRLHYDNDATSLGKLLKYTLPFLRGRRPAWLIRAGLFLYDNLGGRKILPPTRVVKLAEDRTGAPLKPVYAKAFEYSDCWVDDARLVVLNARDAVLHGADVVTRTICEGAARENGHWRIDLRDVETGQTRHVLSKGIVNAGGPWVEDILNGKLRQNNRNGVRLVRGSHIVTRKLFDHDQPYFLQLRDGRIIFAIPYEQQFTLIGTTDHDHKGDPGKAVCTPEERQYLLNAVNQFFERQLADADIVWTYSGVRPLYDDGATSATAATRDYVLTIGDSDEKLPVLSVFGGKITTYRKLAEEALKKLAPYFPEMTDPWTADAPLPGGDFEVHEVDDLIARSRTDFPFLDHRTVTRMVRAYGTEVAKIFANGPGEQLAPGLFQSELDWLIANEWVRDIDDLLWRRSKLGLILTPAEQQDVAAALAKSRRN